MLRSYIATMHIGGNEHYLRVDAECRADALRQTREQLRRQGDRATKITATRERAFWRARYDCGSL